MSFDGAIESFSAGQITGWARYTENSEAPGGMLQIRLHIRDLGPISPVSTKNRPGDSVGFTFVLPSKYQEMPWQDFLDLYEGVFASRADQPGERWRIPFFKSVLSAFNPNNRTAILADRPREYSLSPKPQGKLAALTIVYNEHQILPLWAKYYLDIVGAGNVFVLDQGSDTPYTNLPDGVTVIKLPRESFDNWLIMRLVATFQRHLLESYDSVLYSDSDEFLCVSPEVLAGLTIKQFLLSLPEPIGITTGYNLYHDISTESAIDYSRPLLDQRRFLVREKSMDKPMISRVPLNWIPGFHYAREGGVSIPGMFMLHLRWYDLDAALMKGGRYRASKWDPFDVKNKLANYQRASEDDIIGQFQRRSEVFSKITSTEFSENAEVTVVPDWMRKSITI